MATPVRQSTPRVAPIDNRLWPFSRRTALLAIPIVLITLAFAVALMRATMHWPPSSSDSLVLPGILILSLIPLPLVVVDMIATRGGALELPFVKINFAAEMAPVQSVTITANIGVPGEPIYDSGSQRILDAMGKAVSNDIVVIDLEMGYAWWETRLLVLCAGAVRLRHPSVIVFVATEQENADRFQGWARPDALLPLLLESNRSTAKLLGRAGRFGTMGSGDAASTQRSAPCSSAWSHPAGHYRGECRSFHKWAGQ